MISSYQAKEKLRRTYKLGQIENWELATFKTKSYMPFSVAVYLICKKNLHAHPKKKIGPSKLKISFKPPIYYLSL